MTDWPTLTLVAAPNVGATVLYAFHTSPSAFAEEGVDLGAPEWTGEPGQTGGQDGYRTIKFTHYVAADDSAAVTAMATLSRLLTASSGWLLIQSRAAATPVWARVWRSTPGSISLDRSRVDGGVVTGHYGIDITLTADPYLVGEKAAQSVQTVNNDPASGTNPCRIILPAITGDAPTPLEIKVNPSNTGVMGGYRWMLSMHSGPTQRTPVVWQFGTGDGFTAGTDTSAAAADAAYSGGSYRPVTFATNATLIDRLTGAAPAALSPGRYKVLCRLGRNDTTTTFSVRFGQGVEILSGTFAPFYGDTAYWDRAQTITSTHTAWIDLGEFTFPRGVAPVDALNGTNATPNIALQVGRTSGTGQARLDCLLLVPIETPDTVDAQTLATYFLLGIDGTNGVGVWDGDTERFWQLNTSGVVTPSWPWMEGGFPHAVPGASNVLTVLQQVNGQHQNIALGFALGAALDANDIITVSTAVTVSYRPRWLWPQP